METETIAAIATPAGSGGIGIIRISGPLALAIIGNIFRHKTNGCSLEAGGSGDPPLPYRLTYGHLLDPDTGRTLDEVLVAYMKAPHSYTREDVVEIQAHAGPVGMQAILSLVLRKGARLAEPGEFTRRAFLNGRIDLTQAEAVIDLIQARTGAGQRMAAHLVSGGLKEAVTGLRQALTEILAAMEAGIDFPEELDEDVSSRALIRQLSDRVQVPLEELVQRYAQGHILRDGLRLGVIGRPNVGKSSLMNKLLLQDRVLVTDVPGTTRDTVEETINIHGIPVVIADTAGLHQTDDLVERLSIQKTREVIGRSDLILFVVDGSQVLTNEDEAIFNQIPSERTLLVINKSDRMDPAVPYPVPERWDRIPRIRISALYNQQIDALKEMVAKTALGEAIGSIEGSIVPNLRQKALLEESLAAVRDAVEALRAQDPVELAAIHAQEGLDALGRILGLDMREAVLDEIFSRFCIGK